MVLLTALTIILSLGWASGIAANPGQDPKEPKELYKLHEQLFRQVAYHNLPWGEYEQFDFYPREYSARQYGLVDVVDEDEDVAVDEDVNKQVEGLSATIQEVGIETPSKTVKHDRRLEKDDSDLQPRSTFTFICPTSVQCNDGGCCPLGDYCAIRNGQEGCCPIGSLCDANPIPGCITSCYGICCDLQPNLVGEPACLPTTGDGGQASGICTGVVPSSPLYTASAACLSNEFYCGHECCPNNAGLICDNVTIPNQPFCNLPANVCPPGSKNRLKRQLSGSASTTDDCLATTATQEFSSRFIPQSNATASNVTVAGTGATSSQVPMTTSTSGMPATSSMSLSSSASDGVTVSSGNSATAAASSSAVTTPTTSGDQRRIVAGQLDSKVIIASSVVLLALATLAFL